VKIQISLFFPGVTIGITPKRHILTSAYMGLYLRNIIFANNLKYIKSFNITSMSSLVYGDSRLDKLGSNST